MATRLLIHLLVADVSIASSGLSSFVVGHFVAWSVFFATVYMIASFRHQLSYWAYA
jgi:hypothetical protein